MIKKNKNTGKSKREQLYNRIALALFEGKQELLVKLNQEALEQGANANEILNEGIMIGVNLVIQQFKNGDMLIPDVLLCSRCIDSAMNILRPKLSKSNVLGTIVIGTVEGDLHDFGKNLVSMLLKWIGFEAVDLGTNVTPPLFVDAAKNHSPCILGMSVFLTTNMMKMEETIAALKEAGIRDKVKVIVGGAPVTQDIADKIGADAYGANAAIAVEKARELVS